MKANKLIALVVLTAILLVAAIITNQQNTPITKEKAVLLPGLADSINTLTEISIQSGSLKLNISRQGENWVIKEAGGYPALLNKIEQTAFAITDLKILATKTKKPVLYSKLGVENPAQEGSGARLLTLKDGSGKSLTSLIIGKDRLSKSASDKHSLYVRLPNQEQTLLVEGKLEISTDVVDWIDRELVDVASDRISEISIEHGEVPQVILSRLAIDDNLSLTDIPEGKQLQSNYVINDMKNILAEIQIDQVRPLADINFPDDVTTTTITTFDGLIAVVTSAVLEDTNYATFGFQYTEQELAKEEKTTAEVTKADESESERLDVEKQVSELIEKTSGWVYEIPSRKFQLLTRKMDDLIEDIPEETEEDTND